MSDAPLGYANMVVFSCSAVSPYKLRIKTEGEGPTGKWLEGAETQLLYNRSFAPFWGWQTGIRYDIRPGAEDVAHAVLGLQALAPQWFKTDLAVFLSDDGDSSLRGEFEYDLPLTQRLKLQPRLEFNASASNVPERGIGSGLTSAEAGLRLRYEIRREFAPYLGVRWERLYGDTRDRACAAGVDVPDLSDENLILAGAGDYDAMCADCHGAPGRKPGPMGQGLNPQPPDLADEAEHLTPAELFWVTKHGIRMTGMPAWGVTHDDDALWPVVAFITELPRLNAAAYQALLARGAGMSHHASDQDSPQDRGAADHDHGRSSHDHGNEGFGDEAPESQDHEHPGTTRGRAEVGRSCRSQKP